MMCVYTLHPLLSFSVLGSLARLFGQSPLSPVPLPSVSIGESHCSSVGFVISTLLSASPVLFVLSLSEKSPSSSLVSSCTTAVMTSLEGLSPTFHISLCWKVGLFDVFVLREIMFTLLITSAGVGSGVHNCPVIRGLVFRERK